MQTFSEVKSFDSAFFSNMKDLRPRNNTGTINKRSFFLIPCTAQNWKRAQTFWNRRKPSETISRHWDRRRRDFIYTYASNGVVCVQGYWTHPFCEIPNLNMSTRDMFRQFREGIRNRIRFASGGYSATYGPNRTSIASSMFRDEFADQMLSWYPTLTYFVPISQWQKTAQIAKTVSDQVNSNYGSDQALSVLEIGPGGCLMPLLLNKFLNIARYTAIDLDEVIPWGFFVAEYADPDAAVLPEESKHSGWLQFQTPDNVNLENNSMDLVLNVVSFQEMNNKIVRDYFDLIRRVLRPGGLFLCVNREAKATRFEDYPWPTEGFETLIDEEDFMSQISGRDHVIYRRLIRRVS